LSSQSEPRKNFNAAITTYDSDATPVLLTVIYAMNSTNSTTALQQTECAATKMELYFLKLEEQS